MTAIHLPRALVDADPGRLPGERVDVLVVGSGVAGLCAALALPAGCSVLVATKSRLAQSATRYAQGGIAAVLGLPDAPEDHQADTLAAGAGLCDPDAVRLLVEAGAEAIDRLQRAGTRFDRDEADGALARAREGGHRRPRILHAGGDATGAEVQRALVAAVLASPRIRVAEGAFLVDLLTDDDGAVAGALLATGGSLRLIEAAAVVLASGGAGQLFAQTTNPPTSTGDGIAAALRAGAAAADLEFIQFHPTALHLARDPRPLVSEAVRGEGAVLRDPGGRRVLDGLHPLADLAPRDVVTRAMAARMAAAAADHLYLDATGVDPELLERRFPTVLAACRRAGVDPARMPIPVSPAAHYLMGGVRTDLDGRTSLAGLYAAGEVACTGVHGANRLASNSLLEGVVFGTRAAQALAVELPRPGRPRRLAAPVPAASVASGRRRALRHRMRQLMTAHAGVLRSAPGLAAAKAELARYPATAGAGPAGWELVNLAQLGSVLVELAARRRESRGAHWRADAPSPSEGWQVRQTAARRPDGSLEVTRVPVAVPATLAGAR